MDDAGVSALQALIERSTLGAGPSLRRTFQLPEHALSAQQLLSYWGQGHQQIALATVTTRGAPRVAPVGALLRGALFYVPSEQDAARVRHILARRGVSFTHWISGKVAVIVHGGANIVRPDQPEFGSVDATYSDGGNWWVRLVRAGDGVYVRIEPNRVFTWAADLSSISPR